MAPVTHVALVQFKAEVSATEINTVNALFATTLLAAQQ